MTKPFAFWFPRRLLVAASFSMAVSGCFRSLRTSFDDAGGGSEGTDAATGGRGGDGRGGSTGGNSGGTGGTGGCSATLETDAKNCGACGHDCLGGVCAASVCKPFKLADIPHEVGHAIGLSPDYVLVSGQGYVNGAAAIYTVNRQSGVVNRTRPNRIDGSFSTHLAGTRSTLIAADVLNTGPGLVYLSHCAIVDCGMTTPPSGSYTFDGIEDFAIDVLRGRVFWFDSTSYELISTAADSWSPQSLGPWTVTGQSPCRGMAQGNGRVFGLFGYGVVEISEDGSAMPTLVSALPANAEILEIAVSPESLIMRSVPGTLYKAPLPDGIGNHEPDVISGISGATTIAISGSTLFWSGVSTIYKCDLPLCAQPVPIAQDASVVRDIIADDKAVYWLSMPDVADPTSTVMRLAL